MSTPLTAEQLLAEIDTYARTRGYAGPTIVDFVTAGRVVPALVSPEAPPPANVAAWLQSGGSSWPHRTTQPPRRRR